MTPAPVKARAVDAGIPVLQPERLRDETFLDSFDALRADLAVVAAYGKILPQVLLDKPRLGMINVHASLLPRWRGAAPVHRAIMAGDRKTGVTIMRVVHALDAGPMIVREAIDILPDETSAELERRLAVLGAGMLSRVVDAFAAGTVTGETQDESLVTYAHRIERADGAITWDSSAQAIHDRIRGLHQWPHASAMLQGRRIVLFESRVEHEDATGAAPGEIVSTANDGIVVATEPGAIRLLRVQPEGRGVMAVRDFLNGHPLRHGERFSSVAPS